MLRIDVDLADFTPREHQIVTVLGMVFGQMTRADEGTPAEQRERWQAIADVLAASFPGVAFRVVEGE